MMFDPFGKILEMFHETYPGHDVHVSWCIDLVQQTETSGQCVSPAKPTNVLGDLVARHEIFLDPSLPVLQAMHVLIHELAHVVIPSGCDAHGPDFDSVVDSLTFQFAPTAKEFGLPSHKITPDVMWTDPEEQDAWNVAMSALAHAMWVADSPVQVAGASVVRLGSADAYSSRATEVLKVLLDLGFFVFGETWLRQAGHLPQAQAAVDAMRSALAKS